MAQHIALVPRGKHDWAFYRFHPKYVQMIPRSKDQQFATRRGKKKNICTTGTTDNLVI